MKMYVYLVENKANGSKYIMRGNLKDCNMGSGKYLYEFASFKYAITTPYGTISNISTGMKYNSRQYKIVHQMAV